MTATASPRLGHLAKTARDPRHVAEFYRELLGLQIVRQTSNPLMGEAVLLSGRPAKEDHELVLVTKPQAEHIAFRVNTPQQLATLYRRAKRRDGLPIPYALDSGVALSFFTGDPENNLVEVYFAQGSRGGRSHR